MWLDLKEQIIVEEQQLEQLLEFNKPLLAASRTRELTGIELQSAAAFLHSLYSGIENVFRRISIELDATPPSGEAWHKRLLRSMAFATETRPRVISEDLLLHLMEYLHFRHLFRNLYLFNLDWERMSPLVLGSEQLIADVRAEITVFMASMDNQEVVTQQPVPFEDEAPDDGQSK